MFSDDFVASLEGKSSPTIFDRMCAEFEARDQEYASLEPADVVSEYRSVPLRLQEVALICGEIFGVNVPRFENPPLGGGPEEVIAGVREYVALVRSLLDRAPPQDAQDDGAWETSELRAAASRMRACIIRTHISEAGRRARILEKFDAFVEELESGP